MRVILQPRTLFITLSLACLLAIWLSLALGPVSLPLIDTLRAGLRLLGLPVAGDNLQQAGPGRGCGSGVVGCGDAGVVP
jgi:iron complex transport system permease protein